MAFWLVIGLALAAVALNLLLAPRAKTPKPDAATDFDDPTADAGRPIPVVFGTVTVKGLNLLWFGEKSQSTSKVKA